MTVSIGINLADEAYRRLVAVAESRGEPVHKLVEHLVEVAVAKPAPVDRRRYVKFTPQMRDRLKSLHARGYFDGEIARELGVDRRTVWNWRKRLALSAHEVRSITREYEVAGGRDFRADRAEGRETHG